MSTVQQHSCGVPSLVRHSTCMRGLEYASVGQRLLAVFAVLPTIGDIRVPEAMRLRFVNELLRIVEVLECVKRRRKRGLDEAEVRCIIALLRCPTTWLHVAVLQAETDQGVIRQVTTRRDASH